jgi:hypothetical protein
VPASRYRSAVRFVPGGLAVSLVAAAQLDRSIQKRAADFRFSKTTVNGVAPLVMSFSTTGGKAGHPA